MKIFQLKITKTGPRGGNRHTVYKEFFKKRSAAEHTADVFEEEMLNKFRDLNKSSLSDPYHKKIKVSKIGQWDVDIEEYEICPIADAQFIRTHIDELAIRW